MGMLIYSDFWLCIFCYKFDVSHISNFDGLIAARINLVASDWPREA